MKLNLYPLILTLALISHTTLPAQSTCVGETIKFRETFVQVIPLLSYRLVALHMIIMEVPPLKMEIIDYLKPPRVNQNGLVLQITPETIMVK